MLEPIYRVSDILLGVITALIFTTTPRCRHRRYLIHVRAKLFGALGCNLALGTTDAGVFSNT